MPKKTSVLITKEIIKLSLKGPGVQGIGLGKAWGGRIAHFWGIKRPLCGEFLVRNRSRITVVGDLLCAKCLGEAIKKSAKQK